MDLPIPTVVKAKLKSLGSDQTEITVNFNPASLIYTIENSAPQSGDPQRRQFAAQFTGKLSMELQFDTTDTGKDVRSLTSQVALFMQPSAGASKDKNSTGENPPAPPVLSFEWGSYVFQGFMESFKETIDFFSADGIPLRAMVSVGLARQDKVFDEGADFGQTDTSGSLVPTSADDSATSAAAKGGNPLSARLLASANGLASLRFTNGASLQVGGGIQFKAAAGFTASASAGGGVGLSAGAGAGFSASAQLLGSVGGGPAFGSKASAGVPASLGAFAGLESGRVQVASTAQLNPLRMLPATTGPSPAVGADASFSLGGAATAQSGFSSDVGASFNLSDRLVFGAE